VTPFVGLTVHVPAQLTPTAVIAEAVVASFFPVPVEYCVEVMVRFQPVSEIPTAELSTVSGAVYVALRSVPLSATENEGVADVVRENPALADEGEQRTTRALSAATTLG